MPIPRPTLDAIVPFGFWTKYTPVVPEIYKDAFSFQQQVHDMCCMLHKLVDYSDMLAENINLDHSAINDLEEKFQQFMDSGFEDYYEAELEQYIMENFPRLAQIFLRNGVFFGLNDDGYFVANVANQLEFVLDTISDPSSENYGHLTITY